MKINFRKMHALGNDFVIIDALRQKFVPTLSLVRNIADRHRGVGCDQLLLVEAPHDRDTDFFYRIFNADGTEVEQCGNGARCFAKFAFEQGLIKKRHMQVGTLSGKLELYLQDDGDVSINMGLPQFASKSHDRTKTFLSPCGEKITVGIVSLGNPHAVLLVEKIDNVPLQTIGEFLTKHESFPHGTNVEFMQIVSRNKIKMRIFERGVGETLACGSGACAAVVIGNIWQLLDAGVLVNMPGGDLTIFWSSPTDFVWLKGSATTIFDGTLDV